MRWVMPGATLAVIPKCPACVAGYIAMATGIGVSVTAAAYLRWSLIVLCVATLCYAGWRAARGYASRRRDL